MSGYPYSKRSSMTIFRLTSDDRQKNLFMALDTDGSVLTTTVNTFETDYAPNLATNIWTGTTPTLTSTTYNGLKLNMDGNLGTSSTIAVDDGSLGGTVITNNCFTFNWTTGSNTSPEFTITSYSADNSNFRTVKFNVALSGAPNPPTTWQTTTPTTQLFPYTTLQLNFTTPIQSGGVPAMTVTSSGGNNPTNLSVVSGRAQFDWTPSANSSVTLTFDNVFDGTNYSSNNQITVNLYPESEFQNFSGTNPQSQSYQYTGLLAQFSQDLQSFTNITASASGTITNAVIHTTPSQIQFDYLTDTDASETLTFNGLLSVDGAQDVPPIENVVLTLVTPPTSFVFFQNEPNLPSTTFTNIQISADKNLNNVSSVTSNLAGAVTNVSITDNKVEFDYTTPADITGLQFTLTEVYSTDGGRVASTVVTVNPGTPPTGSGTNVTVNLNSGKQFSNTISGQGYVAMTSATEAFGFPNITTGIAVIKASISGTTITSLTHDSSIENLGGEQQRSVFSRSLLKYTPTRIVRGVNRSPSNEFYAIMLNYNAGTFVYGSDLQLDTFLGGTGNYSAEAFSKMTNDNIFSMVRRVGSTQAFVIPVANPTTTPSIGAAPTVFANSSFGSAQNFDIATYDTNIHVVPWLNSGTRIGLFSDTAYISQSGTLEAGNAFCMGVLKVSSTSGVVYWMKDNDGGNIRAKHFTISGGTTLVPNATEVTFLSGVGAGGIPEASFSVTNTDSNDDFSSSCYCGFFDVAGGDPQTWNLFSCVVDTPTSFTYSAVTLDSSGYAQSESSSKPHLNGFNNNFMLGGVQDYGSPYTYRAQILG